MKHLITAAALLAIAACSGPGGLTPSSPVTNEQFAGTTRMGQPMDRRGSDPLIYIADAHTGLVDVYSYPSLALVGTLTDVAHPETVCVSENYDASVWVGGYDSSGNSELVEYAHGGTTPLVTLDQPGPQVKGCAPIDNSRVLSADSDEIAGKSVINVASWNMKKPSAPPQIFTDIPNMQAITGIARNESGVAYVSGYDATNDFILDRFQPYQAKTFTQIPITITVSSPGSVYAIGPKLFIEDKSDANNQAVVYQINPVTGALMATTTLASSTDCEAYTVAKIASMGQQQLFCADVNTGSVDIYNWPQGGTAIGHITGLSYPVGVAVSRIPPSPSPSPSP